MNPPVLIETADGVLTITWNRPERLNALTAAMLDAAAEAVEKAGDDVRLVVLTGTGRAFCSGADLGDAGPATIDAANRLVRAITSSPRPVLAAVHGLAAGGGCSLAIAADITIARSEAYFLLAFVNVGLMPDGGATQLVAASIGRARANRMAMLGDKLSAADAVDVGLIHASADQESYEQDVAALVERLGNGPTQALATMKAAIAATTLSRLDEALDRERAGQVALFSTHDAFEGGSAFLEKRAARFEGR